MNTSMKSPKNDKMSIVRIAPVCGGKIYITSQMDIPIREEVMHITEKSDKTARKVLEKYQNHIHTEASPRFCVKHRSATEEGITIYLYVLPLKAEEEISFHGGKFVTEEEIQANTKAYTPDFQTESEFLCMAAELWESFG